MIQRVRLCCCLLFAALPAAAELPDGYWPAERSQPILDSRLEVTLAPDLGHLSPAERQALDELLTAGAIMHSLYEQQLHPPQTVVDSIEALTGSRRVVPTMMPATTDARFFRDRGVV